MSQLHAELSEQASELGFETIQDAVNSGYTVDYSKGKLVKRGLGYSEAVEYLAREQEKAHEAWLKERDEVLKGLEMLNKTEELSRQVLGDDYIDLGESERINRAIKFIKEQCHD